MPLGMASRQPRTCPGEGLGLELRQGDDGVPEGGREVVLGAARRRSPALGADRVRHDAVAPSDLRSSELDDPTLDRAAGSYGQRLRPRDADVCQLHRGSPSAGCRPRTGAAMATAGRARNVPTLRVGSWRRGR